MHERRHPQVGPPSPVDGPQGPLRHGHPYAQEVEEHKGVFGGGRGVDVAKGGCEAYDLELGAGEGGDDGEGVVCFFVFFGGIGGRGKEVEKREERKEASEREREENDFFVTLWFALSLSLSTSLFRFEFRCRRYETTLMLVTSRRERKE